MNNLCQVIDYCISQDIGAYILLVSSWVTIFSLEIIPNLHQEATRQLSLKPGFLVF